MESQIPKSPVKIKREAAKIRIPAKLAKKSETLYTEMFEGMTPPQQRIQPVSFGGVSLADISADQLQALQRDNFALWAATSGLEVDHKPFNFSDHKYMLPMYLDMSKEIVLMKSAQMGATIWMLLRLIWFTLYNSAKACLFFPTQDGVSKLSKDRLAPLIYSNARLQQAVKDTDTIGYKKIGDKSSLYLQHMGGEATKDSTPFDMICFDEVRLLSPADIDQARERLSHSTYKYVMQVSTAGHPGCFHGDTKVIVFDKYTNQSTQIAIKDLVENYTQYKVLSYNQLGGKRLRWRNIKTATCTGIRPVVDVKLWGGQHIICTPDHPFAVATKIKEEYKTLEWIPIEIAKLYPNSYGGSVGPEHGVLTALEVPEYNNGQWNQKVVDAPFDQLTLAMIGCFISEGSIHHTEICIWQNKGKPIQKLAEQWAVSQGLSYRNAHDCVFISVARRPDLLALFEECGKGEPNKKFPESVIRGSRAQLEIVMRWIIEGDGHVRKIRQNTHESRREFDIYTSSKTLAHQLLFVGLKIGKPLAIFKRSPREKRIYNGKIIKGNHIQYQLTYNPFAFRCQTVFPQLGQVAVSSVTPVGTTEVYDLQVEGFPGFVLAESGCLVHNTDIARAFIRGTQNYWHVKCSSSCSDGFIPSETWPDCIAVTEKEVYLICPRCRKRIDDAQQGQFIAHNPHADYPSYHISQFLSKFISVKEIWDAWQRTQNIKEFYNAKLGKPYVDEENQPVKDDDLDACVNSDIQWGKSKPIVVGAKIQRAMGVDQMGGNNYVVIAERHSNKKRIVHYEIIDDRNDIYMEDGRRVTPFKRVYQLMNEFDIDLCLIDAMPNINEAIEFGRTFPKRVFVTFYIEAQRDMVQWEDRAKEKVRVKKGGPGIKFKYVCLLSRYLSMDYALSEIANRNVEWSVPERLIQVCRSLESGLFEPLHIFKTHFYTHMKSMVRQKTMINEETGKFKMEWISLGLDAHSSHAWNLCNVALERLRRQPIFVI